MKVAMLSVNDHAGSAFQYRTAARSAGIDAKLFVVNAHQYGYQNDGLIEYTNGFLEEIYDCDVIHYKGDHLPSDPLFCGVHNLKKPVVITVGGSGFRRFAGERSVAHEWHPIEAYKSACEVFTAITLDLCYNGYGIRWLPHALNASFGRQEGRGIIVAHSPSKRQKKGTDSVFLPAMNIVKRAYPSVKVDLIEGVSYAECLKRKAACSVFFDQAVVPFYGMSAVEAMAMGTPVVTYITDDLFGKDSRLKESGITAFSSPTPEDAASAIIKAIEDRAQIEGKIKAYFQSVHSHEAVGKELTKVYELAIKRFRLR
jgi:hypothetical protein